MTREQTLTDLLRRAERDRDGWHGAWLSMNRAATRYLAALHQLHDLADAWTGGDAGELAANVMRIAYDALEAKGQDDG